VMVGVLRLTGEVGKQIGDWVAGVYPVKMTANVEQQERWKKQKEEYDARAKENARRKQEAKEERYSHAKIVRVENIADAKEFFIGMTIQKSIQKYFEQLCKQVARGEKSRLHDRMREVGVTNFTVKVIENYPCKEQGPLLKRRDKWLTYLSPSLNCIQQYYAQKRWAWTRLFQMFRMSGSNQRSVHLKA
jgi:hypothetical protein